MVSRTVHKNTHVKIDERRFISYAEKLKDERWQDKRLAVLSHANNTCEDCGTRDGYKHVHHRTYAVGKEPWDYPDENFVCVCEPCHTRRENLIQKSRLLFQICDQGSADVFIRRLEANYRNLDEILLELAFYLAIREQAPSMEYAGGEGI